MASSARHLDLEGRTGITAILGPTNTGKTHQAIERMLRFRSGMIGLPLRLLAREVYDRVAARAGAQAVALITGEEKRIPRQPRYYVCTVEAMPLQRPVAFLAVDEVQLAAHRERGHVFTDRLLRARGLKETLFLGADTVAPLLKRLVPSARFESYPRFSTLSYAGPRRLAALPPRSAVVAFSADRVYELAERLKQRHGGTAVVLGALSPRTRNAQVAMYQAGEVQHMVATDAIGMGLNLDLDHVALSGLRKFDGAQRRALDAAEVGQIAGRAGRFRRDGSFGVTADLQALDGELVAAVENHVFPPLRFLMYRNAELDFSSVDALLASLRQPPPAAFLRRVRGAEDERSLAALAQRPELRRAARGAAAVRLLWEVCQVPDFRQLLSHDHFSLLAALYAQLSGPGEVLDEDWVARRIERLDRVDGEIHALMNRIAFVRTWTYVSHHRRWLRDAKHWQARSRSIEDRLSDALHERLAQRFVDRRAVLLINRGQDAESTQMRLEGQGQLKAGEHLLGRLCGLRFIPAKGVDGRSNPAAWRALRRAVEGVLADRIAQFARAAHEEFEADREGMLCWQGSRVAQLQAGQDILQPKARPLRNDLLNQDQMRAVRARLLEWTRALAPRLLAPLRDKGIDQGDPALRGLLYQLEQGLGCIPRQQTKRALSRLDRRQRRQLARCDVRLGTEHVYVASLLSAEQLRRRSLLWAVFHGLGSPPVAPDGELASLPRHPQLPAEYYRAVSYPLAGELAIRVDQLEALAQILRQAARRGRFRAPARAAELLSCSSAQLEAAVQALGYRPAGRLQGQAAFRAPGRRPRG